MYMIIIGLFGLAALGGLYLISYVLKGKNTPKGVAIIHGSAAGLALLTLLVAAFFNHKLFYAAGVFILAAIGGGFIFMIDLSGKKIPKGVALAHGIIAILGFILLLILLF